MRANEYRADIDGLRALAILPVLLFHASIPGFSGGFVGVDIFFVISGYLITSIIVREFAENKYSIVTFYERRLRRIFPALLTVLFFTLVVSPFFLLPSEFKTLGGDTFSALFFFANINFWRQSGYFATDAETKPLLHIWSLGVEEQFYLFMPLLLWLVFRHLKRHGLAAVGLMLLISLVLCIFLTRIKPTASFYLLPTRAWELLAGAWLAIFTASGFTPGTMSFPLSSWLRTLLGFLGLALVLFAIFTYTASTPFPGYSAMAPVVGAALLIYAGRETLSGRLLASKLLVKIGRISYSLYLWHWPLVVFFRDAGWLASPFGKAGVVVLSVIAAELTFRFIESPTRDRNRFPTRKLVKAMAGAAAFLATVSVVYSVLHGWPSRLPPDVVAMDNARYNSSPSRERCHVDDGLPDPGRSCVLGEDGNDVVNVAVWADSHGVELSQAISELDIPVRMITYSACTPAVGYTSRISRPLCARHNQQTLDYLLATPSITTVVLTTYFNPDQQDQQVELLKGSALMLHQAGKQVVLVGPTPILGDKIDVPTWLARGGSRYVPYTGLHADWLRKQFAGTADVFIPEELFCPQGVCDLLPQGKPLLFDSHHPSMDTARLIAEKLLPIVHQGIR